MVVIIIGILVAVGHGRLAQTANQDAYSDCLSARNADGATSSPMAFQTLVDLIEVPADLRSGKFAPLSADLLTFRGDTDAAGGVFTATVSSDLSAVLNECAAKGVSS